jgi:His-Xaa-Ser system radical SAM maturase HxsB
MKEYRKNFLRRRKLVDGFLVTTEDGSWDHMSEQELSRLSGEDLSEDEITNFEKKNLIITDSNREKILNSLREKYSFLSSGTSLHIVVITLRCNQHCVYCHASSCPMNKEGFDMDDETIRKTVDFIFQSPSPAITIEVQGGEPLLNYEGLRKLVVYAKEKNKQFKKDLKITVVTNFKFLDSDKLDYFEREGIDLCTSLDGPKFLHELNRNLGTYEPTINWLKEIAVREKEKGILHPNAILTVTRESLKYPREIVDEYVSHDLRDIHVRFLHYLGNAKGDWGNICYSSEEFLSFWRKTLDYIIELNLKGVPIRERGATILLKKIFGTEPNYLEIRSPCGAAIGQLLYNYNGDLYTCDEARMIGEDIFKLGNVHSDNYNEVLSSDQTCGIVAASINDTQICNSCAYKPYCGICPVCNYAEQGSVVAKIPETMRCNIYKAQFDYLFEKLLSSSDARSVFMSWVDPSFGNV